MSRHSASETRRRSELLDWLSALVGGASLGVAAMYVAVLRDLTPYALVIAAVLFGVGSAVAVGALVGRPVRLADHQGSDVAQGAASVHVETEEDQERVVA